MSGSGEDGDSGESGVSLPDQPIASGSEPDDGDTEIPSFRQRFLSFGSRVARSYVVLVVVGVVVGLLVAPVASTVVTDPVTGTVAIVPVEGGIDGQSATETVAMLERARADPSIDAVVLRVNSPGGSASASETMYLAVERTAAEMPVVTSSDALVASGAYYTAVSSDYIYAKPSSLIGSIGVIFVRPPSAPPSDRVVTTGPDKLSGANAREWFYNTEALKQAFVNAVVESRGDRLEMPRSRVATAEIFTGAEAVDAGLADEIGGIGDAVAKAADMAGLSRYDVTVLRPDGTTQFVTQSAYLASNASDKELVSPAYFVDDDGSSVPNYLMLPPSLVREAVVADAREANATASRATVAGGGTANATANETRRTTEVVGNGTR